MVPTVRGLAQGMAFVLLAGGCANSLLLIPSREPLETSASPRTIACEGRSLELWTLRSPQAPSKNPDFYVLSFIGNADRAEVWSVSELQLWQTTPVEVWAVNYPGYGKSSGPASLDRIPSSALAAYDEIRKVCGDAPVIVSGNSLGTAVALHVAANRPAAGLVLRNPPPIRNVILGRHGWWNLWIAAGIVACQVPSELDSIANAAKLQIPAVFILSSDDEVVPAAYQQDVVDAYAGRKRIVSVKGGHNVRVSPRLIELQGALEWLRTELPRSARSVEK